MATPIARIEIAVKAKLRYLRAPFALFNVVVKPDPEIGSKLAALLRERAHNG